VLAAGPSRADERSLDGSGNNLAHPAWGQVGRPYARVTPPVYADGVGQPEVGASLRDQYERQGHPYYATARLWDDGVIDPRDTRDVLGLALSAAAGAPLDDVGYGVFRM